MLCSYVCFFRSAFLHFSGDKRPKLKADDPNLTVAEIAKHLGAAWKIMTLEQKKPYEDIARDDRGRYEREMNCYREMQKSLDKRNQIQ